MNHPEDIQHWIDTTHLAKKLSENKTFEEGLEELAEVTSRETGFRLEECRRMIRSLEKVIERQDGF
jgi:hypothetical protein